MYHRVIDIKIIDGEYYCFDKIHNDWRENEFFQIEEVRGEIVYK